MDLKTRASKRDDQGWRLNFSRSAADLIGLRRVFACVVAARNGCRLKSTCIYAENLAIWREFGQGTGCRAERQACRELWLQPWIPTQLKDDECPTAGDEGLTRDWAF
jgi:hypothetical protein